MQDFRKLMVWRAARELTRFVYALTADFPSSEEFGLKAQMRRASVSVCSNIAEGCGRRSQRDFRRLLDVSMGSACELQCELILSFDLELITEGTLDATLGRLVEVKRMLTRLMRRLLTNKQELMTENRQPKTEPQGCV